MLELGTARSLSAQETLFRAGEDDDDVFVVVDGTLDVIHATPEGDLVVATLEANEVVGEITAVVGGRRTATVRAGDSGAQVRQLSADEYAAWLEERPDEGRRIARQARDRIDRTRVARVLSELIGPDHRQVIEDVTNQLEWTRLDAGQVLFRQGEIADAAYIVVTGRLRITAEADDSKGHSAVDTSIGRGDIVGELGIIEQAPRSATAVATRDTTLARLSESTFAALTAKHPRLMLQVFRKVLTRIMRPNQRPPHAGMIAVAVLCPTCDNGLVRAISREIQRHDTTLYLDREQVGRFFQRRGVTDVDTTPAEEAQLDEFLSEADVAHRWVVLETDRTLTTWTRRALRSADRVILVTSPFPDDRERDLIEQFAGVVDGAKDRELWLVQSNHPAILRPTVSERAVRAARPDRVIQHHRGNALSTARVARMASGTATGVAMSGGGARAFAQIGAVQALAEDGVHIDVLTGTSMGSIVASMLAYWVDPADLLAGVQASFQGVNVLDYTLPLVALTAGKELSEALDNYWGPMQIEELILPFTCLSTNLTTASLVEHRTGNLSQALRASVSLPGIFPPVVQDNSVQGGGMQGGHAQDQQVLVEHNHLLVDGGILENLPVGPLVRDPAVQRVIAIDVAAPDGPRASAPYGNNVGGTTALRSRVGGRPREYPAITSTVMASMLLSSARARNDALSQAHIDLYLSLNLKGVKLLDFNDIGTVSDRGYQATIDQLASR